MSHFKSKLVTERLEDGKWRLVEDLVWISDANEKGIDIFDSKLNDQGLVEYRVEAPFDTDLASVPRFLWWLVSPWDIARAAVLHDSMYQRMRDYEKELSKYPSDKFLWEVQDKSRHRKKADIIFLNSMKDCKPKPSSIVRKFCYLAVRLMGWRYT